jgi:hypothetical protein
MEAVRNFFTKDNMYALFGQFYRWLEGLLENVFGNYSYEPLRVLLTNPLFWIIIIVLIILGFAFRRR